MTQRVPPAFAGMTIETGKYTSENNSVSINENSLFNQIVTYICINYNTFIKSKITEMKKFSLLIVVMMFSLKLFAQDVYQVEYKFSEKPTANVKNFTLSRSGDNIKIKGTNTNGATVTMWVFKGEGNIYTLTETRDVRIGVKYRGLDCNYIGMQWGVYILDLPKCEFVTTTGTVVGTVNIAGKETTMYNLASDGSVKTDIYIYDNKLMLKRDAPTTIIEALSFNESPTFAADEFTLPAGITWLEN